LTAGDRLVAVGRVGKPHGRDGSFYVDEPSHPLPAGLPVTIAGRDERIARRAGTDERPLLRLAGVTAREQLGELRGEAIMLPLAAAPLEPGEWLSEDLVGCEIPGIGAVRRVVSAPSCDVLEVGPEGVLVPFIADAVKKVDVDARRIDVDRDFLGLEERS
jgi:16S rRNA processing protein RimM